MHWSPILGLGAKFGVSAIGGATEYAREVGYAKHTLFLDPSIKFHCHIYVCMIDN